MDDFLAWAELAAKIVVIWLSGSLIVLGLWHRLTYRGDAE